MVEPSHSSRAVEEHESSRPSWFYQKIIFGPWTLFGGLITEKTEMEHHARYKTQKSSVSTKGTKIQVLRTINSKLSKIDQSSIQKTDKTGANNLQMIQEL